MRKLIFLFGMVFLLSSCRAIIPPPQSENEVIQSNDEQETVKATATPTPAPTPAPTLAPTPAPAKPYEPKKTKQQEQQEKYMPFINEYYSSTSKNPVIFETEECDLDFDSNPEIVISVNDKTEIYILRDENGKISQVGGNINEDGMYSNFKNYKISFVKLKNSKSPYIYVRYQNFGMYIASFSLYQLVDNEILLIEDSNSGNATGEGYNYLIDKDNNGYDYYDGYAVYRWGYDVLNYHTYDYPVTEYYVWDSEANAFYFDYTSTYADEGLNEIPELIYRYLMLKCTYDADKSTEIAEQLADLLFREDHSFLENELDYIAEFMRNHVSSPDDLKLNMVGGGYMATVHLTLDDGQKLPRHVKFDLVNEDKWQISTVTTNVFVDYAGSSLDYMESFPKEIFESFDTVNEFIEREGWANIILWTDDILKDISIVRIEYVDAKESWKFLKKEVLYELDEITPSKPLLLKTLLPELIPWIAIIYTDENGKTQPYCIVDSGMDGSLHLVPIDLK